MTEQQAPRGAATVEGVRIQGREVDGVILDLDGVITRTARLHARAWKRMFDDFLQKRAESENEPFRPFSIDEDYRGYVDGKPRYDGVRSFLQSRGIQLPDGEPADPPDRQTVCGLGNRKNEYFHELLDQGSGVEVFDDAVERIHDWRSRGLKTAVVSSSKNCAAIVRAAGLDELFDARVDGVRAEAESIPGKPAPDTFLKAAEELGVPAERAVVVEDAVAGVQAGRAGNFALVVGVARRGGSEALAEHGADVVVQGLDELMSEGYVHGGRAARLPSALDEFDEIARRLAGKRAAVFLDYDGTLSPIVRDPDRAFMAPSMREAVRELAKVAAVAIVSGRDRQAVENFVQLEQLFFAGSHGFDIRGPGCRHEYEGGAAALPDLDEAERKLGARLAPIAGALVERKRFALAIHYRNVAEQEVDAVETAVDEVHEDHPRLRKRGGKKVFELQPNIDWHKGRAVLWLLQTLQLDSPDVLPFYVGDDLTDEDAFRALAGRGVGILVGEAPAPSMATFWLPETSDVEVFLRRLTDLLRQRLSDT